MRPLLAGIFLFLCVATVSGQIAAIEPKVAGPDDEITLIFDATQGNKELVGASKVYVHHGVVTDNVSGTAWRYVKGNWGKDDGIGEMTRVPGETDKWQLKMGPSVRAYYGVPAGENIFRIACVFRSADGSKKGTMSPGNFPWGTVTSNLDLYLNLSNDNYITIKNPLAAEGFHEAGQPFSIQGEASATVTSMKLLLDTGSGYQEVASVTGGKNISFNYIPTTSVDLGIRLTATINGSPLEVARRYNLVVRKQTLTAALPTGMTQGVNYDASDPTKATLVFLAPYKEFVYAVGDFSDWKLREDLQMKRTPDNQYYWIELTGLEPGKDYVYQYWIDGKLKIADPYTRQVADPWNDKYIEPAVFPGLPAYNREDLGIASVLRTGQAAYSWDVSESQWQRPDVNHLVVYELHIRDFIASHSYKDLTDTLTYLKRLGVNAIELMPVSEFEGNDSWGYNPSFYFATDKYYGTADKLKKFIETAHKEGMAVILDMVLNHSFGQSPMVQMYFEGGKPAANNPWYNREYVGQYQWGYDFNHESQYTKNFIDDVNRYWLEEFHFDGYRFDFTKGFTNYAPGGSVDGFDQSRINILKRMADKIKQVDPKAYIILEHWSPANEEAQLASYGMKMWRNKSYDFVPATIGTPVNGSFGSTDATSHITFYNSHDERRIAEHCLTEGYSNGVYNVRDSLIMFERVKMAAAFMFLQPGPKMMWQFDELGYDIDINFNGRIGRKPAAWGPTSLKYYTSVNRQNIYKAYAGILDVRKQIGPDKLASAIKNHQQTGDTRRLSYNTTGTDLVVVGNFGLVSRSIDPKFTQTGKWYDYFSGDSLVVTNVSTPVSLKAGEWHIYTTKRLANGQPGVVSVYDNPVTISPYPFKGSDQIKIRFDAKKAFPGTTAGLVGADKVYIHSGVIVAGAGNSLTNVVGNLTDDGVGQMTKVGEDLWEITLTPNVYYNIAQGKEILKMGMWFRNGDNTQRGYGFRNSVIFADVLSDLPVVTVSPASFDQNTEITITFNARAGNRELMGADKVYLHSGVGTVDTQSPQSTAWNKVVGNWGTDDGVGKMTKVAGQQDIWQIKLTPKTYYNMNAAEHPYWLGAVFRNAAGSTKGTTTPGTYDFGLVASNLDYFLKNQRTVATGDEFVEEIRVYPNPASSGLVYVTGIVGKASLNITDVAGKMVMSLEANLSEPIDISALNPGLYYLRISKGEAAIVRTLVVYGR